MKDGTVAGGQKMELHQFAKKMGPFEETEWHEHCGISIFTP